MPTRLVRILTDLGLYGLFCFLLGTGLLIHYRLVPGSAGGHGLTFLGLGRHDWGALHFWASIAFLALIVVHLALNFRFIRNVIAHRLTTPLVALLVGGVLIVGFFLAIPLEHDARDGRGQRHQDHTTAVDPPPRLPGSSG